MDAVWPAAARPLPPSGMLRVHPVKYAGVDVAAKLADVRAKLAMNGVHGLAVTSLDEICYVYNIRGCDVPCNPVAISYAFIIADKAFLFVDAEKVDEVVGAHLLESGVEVLPYDSAISTISGASNSGKIWVDSKTANYKLFSAIKEDKRVAKDSPLVIMKARKNEAELRCVPMKSNKHYHADKAFLIFYSFYSFYSSRTTEVCATATSVMEPRWPSSSLGSKRKYRSATSQKSRSTSASAPSELLSVTILSRPSIPSLVSAATELSSTTEPRPSRAKC